MQSAPYTKRNVRAAAREARLKGLGYSSYSAYLSSPAWRDVKRRYFEEHPRLCICGEIDVHLHHITYDRVGAELLDDLVPLCGECHAHVHVLESTGLIGLDLQGFYFDPARADEGRMLLAQLAAACPDGDVLREDKRRAFEKLRVAWDLERFTAMKARARDRPRQRREALHAGADDMGQRTFQP